MRKKSNNIANLNVKLNPQINLIVKCELHSSEARLGTR